MNSYWATQRKSLSKTNNEDRDPNFSLRLIDCKRYALSPSHQTGIFVTTDEHALTYVIIQVPQFSLGFTAGVVHGMVLDECMSCVNHYIVTQSMFPDLKILCSPPIHLPFSQLLATIDPVTISIVLPFPECHIVCRLFRLTSLMRYTHIRAHT